MYTFDSGIELNTEFPDSFYIPPAEDKRSLTKGDIVKLIFRKDHIVERMWVIITEVNRGEKLHFKGTLDNQPYELESVKRGDLITFDEDHIIQIAE